MSTGGLDGATALRRRPRRPKNEKGTRQLALRNAPEPSWTPFKRQAAKRMPVVSRCRAQNARRVPYCRVPPMVDRMRMRTGALTIDGRERCAARPTEPNDSAGCRWGRRVPRKRATATLSLRCGTARVPNDREFPSRTDHTPFPTACTRTGHAPPANRRIARKTTEVRGTFRRTDDGPTDRNTSLAVL
jgi:hypothetical protein